jgi:predicted alpha/beta hydrolase
MADATPDNVFIDDIILPAVDGFALAGTLFLARGRKTHAILINSDIGVPRETYRAFAAYLASRGCAVLTYDYRGIGGSRPTLPGSREKSRTLKGFDASLSDWAARDVTAAVAWMRGRYKELPLSYVGHGFGGQALGLIPNSTDISRALLVAAQAGYWKLVATPQRYRTYLLANLLGAPVAKMRGYMPGWLSGTQDLPKGVFLQWARWTADPRYFFDDKTLPALGNFANYTGPLRALCFTDDSFAPPLSVELLAREFTATRAQIIAINPTDVGAAKVGHHGFFGPEMRERMWRGVAEWLDADAIPQRTYSAAARA